MPRTLWVEKPLWKPIYNQNVCAHNVADLWLQVPICLSCPIRRWTFGIMREGCGGFIFHCKHSGNLNGNPAVSIGKERKIKKNEKFISCSVHSALPYNVAGRQTEHGDWMVAEGGQCFLLWQKRGNMIDCREMSRWADERTTGTEETELRSCGWGAEGRVVGWLLKWLIP